MTSEGKFFFSEDFGSEVSEFVKSDDDDTGPSPD